MDPSRSSDNAGWPRSPWYRDCWYVVGWSEEFPTAKLVPIAALDEQLVFYRCDDQTIVALEDRCCHRWAPLSLGHVEGENVRCSYHGLKFARDGRCIEIPGGDRIPAHFWVRSYPVVERYGWVWFWPGEQSNANVTLIPPCASLEDYIFRIGAMGYRAHASLICDNLLDLSHLSFLHQSAHSFGAGQMDWALVRPKITRLARGVRIERWISNDRYPSNRLSAKLFDMPARIDRWVAYDFMVPGILVLKTEYHPVGTADAAKGGPPGRRPLHSACTCQAILPISISSSQLFYSFGPSAVTGTSALADEMIKTLGVAFEEDRRMVEAQQVNASSSRSRKMSGISADEGLENYWSVLRLLESPMREQPPSVY